MRYIPVDIVFPICGHKPAIVEPVGYFNLDWIFISGWQLVKLPGREANILQARGPDGNPFRRGDAFHLG